MSETGHIHTEFDRDLADINNEIARLGALVEGQLNTIINDMTERDPTKLDDIIAKDSKLDEIELQLNEKIITMIALRTPLAGDLRRLIAVLKIATMLERCGDYVKSIAKRSKLIFSESDMAVPEPIIELGRMVQEMMHLSLDSYMAKDIEAALRVREEDMEADMLYISCVTQVLKQMETDTNLVQSGSHLLFIAKNLERIGDYTTGIAEQVYFLVHGVLPPDERPKADIE